VLFRSWTPVHCIHLMLVTLMACIGFALGLNHLLGGRARFGLSDPGVGEEAVDLAQHPGAHS
jgi:hypothetical protein